jgi:ubiquinone/menaquinone biosynthesis C-methylase UbiE
MSNSQFSLPEGLLGHLVGRVMTWQNENLNQFATRELSVRAGDRVLEIGCGPGMAIHRLTKKSQARQIIGIDRSDEMLAQAAVENSTAIDQGRVALLQATAAAVPLRSGRFNQVFAVSTFHDWDSRAAGLSEARRLLSDGGRLVLCLRMMARHPRPWSAPGLTQNELVEDLELLKLVRFHDVRVVKQPGIRRAVCLVGVK